MVISQKQQYVTKSRIWVYAVLPALILNLGSLLTYGLYYSLYYIQPEMVSRITTGAVRAATDILIFIVEWIFAISVIGHYRSAGLSIKQMLAPHGDISRFRWLPSTILFASWNLLFALYMLVLGKLYPAVTDVYQGLPFGVRLIQLTLIPITAAFCEELIWRGYIPTQMELRGYRYWPVVLLSSLSFAAIHEVFLPDKLLVTFLLGIISTVYYLKERNLVPLMLTHWFVDLWSFGLFMFS